MDFQDRIQPGLTDETSFTVESQHSARHIGSGSLRVLATPVMIGWMENTSHRLLAGHLPEGYSSVGVLVEVRHLAPTPVGDQVRIRTEVIAVVGSQVTFNVEAWDNQEKIGEGRHVRFIIDEARFLKRVAAKSASSGPARE